MEPENLESSFQLRKQLFNCKICTEIFVKPVTLNCGHTFCKNCIKDVDSYKDHSMNKKGKKNKIPICPSCQSIIWRPIQQHHENKTLQSLLQRYKLQRQSQKMLSQNIKQQEHFEPFEDQFMNKILLTCKKPKTFPMPSCFTQIVFKTFFIEDITEQSKQLVLMWDDPTFPYALLGSLTQIQPLNSSNSSKIFVHHPTYPSNLQQEQYKGIFMGHHFVELTDVGSITIDLSHRLIVVGDQKEKTEAELNICDCKIVHPDNHYYLQSAHFDNFFTFYDLMNNPHYMRQISTLINQQPFQNRNNPEMMMYCVLRVLKIPETKREQMVKCWDELKRIDMINDWLIEKQNGTLDEIMNIKIPGKYNQGFVFFIIFILFALNFFQE